MDKSSKIKHWQSSKSDTDEGQCHLSLALTGLDVHLSVFLEAKLFKEIINKVLFEVTLLYSSRILDYKIIKTFL